MKYERKIMILATVLSGLLLAGLLLVFGLEQLGIQPFGPQAGESLSATPSITTAESYSGANDAGPTATVTPDPQAVTPSATPTDGPAGTPVTGSTAAVHFLNVGEGSCTLICSGQSAILIDGGDAPTSAYVVSYLKKLGIQKLDLVIATHYDSDHISGIGGVLMTIPVDLVLGPEGAGATKTYESFCEVIQKKGVKRRNVKKNGEWLVLPDEVMVEFLPTADPAEASGEDGENGADSVSPERDGRDSSLAMVVTVKGKTLLIMGDAEAAKERRLAGNGCISRVDIFVVNHHGSRFSNTSELLAEARPEWAVISCGENEYGHPAKECIDRLKSAGAKIFRTDVQGTIVLHLAGKEILCDVPALQNPYAGPSEETVVSRQDVPENVTFILNGNSKVYHLPTCESVSGEMHRNWFYFYGSAADAQALGYRPCGRCLK